MPSPTIQGFQGTELPISCPVNGSTAVYSQNRTSQTDNFSNLLERASANQTQYTEPQNQTQCSTGTQTNSAQSDERTVSLNQNQQAEQTCQRFDHTGKNEQVNKPAQASAQDTNQTGTSTVGAKSDASTQPADTTQSSSSGDASKEQVVVTISATDTKDDVKVELQGLPEELLSALLAAIQDKAALTPLITVSSAKQQDSSADKDSLSADPADTEAATSSLPDGKDSNEKFTLKIQLDASDPTKDINQLLSLLQTIAGALQSKASTTADIQPETTEALGLMTSKDTPLSTLAQTVPKEASKSGAFVNTRSTTIFENLFSDVKGQNTTSISDHETSANDPLNGQTNPAVIFDNPQDVKVTKALDTVESLLSKVKAAITVVGALKQNDAAPESSAAPVSSAGSGSGSLNPDGAWVQESLQQHAPSADVTGAASFGNIVTDRLAAVAEQVGLRDKPADVTLRLRMESGESIMVGMKEQAGKIVVQVKSADQNMVGFLESHKETIVRNLESKQILSTISVSPIDENLADRRGREQQTKDRWERRRQPANPFIQTTV